MNSTARLLVVEQEEHVRKFLQAVLVRSGYEVQTARSAEEAIETLDRSIGFDAVLSETTLPGMNGHELAWHVAVLHPASKMIFVTASHVDCGRCPYPVHYPLIAKPFAPRELVRRVAEVLGDSPWQSN